MIKKNFRDKEIFLKIIKNSLVNLPTPVSISFLWNIGFLLGIILTLQIITGLVLSINYTATADTAFYSVVHIMRDIESGWWIRYLHANGASLFFAFMYTHLLRGIYFNSPQKLPIVWVSGVVIVLSSIGAAFMGYVLPWGQMSFWGATVITRIITAIPYLGESLTKWLWGNFSVSQPTLNRFFSFHFLIPFVVIALVVAHLILIHKTGSSNPLGVETNKDKIKFFPFFIIKDTGPLLVITITLLVVLSLRPNILGDVENFTPASSEVTPTHIQPEWYFLFAYAILRAIPSKLGGVAAIVMAILILAKPVTSKLSINRKFSPTKKIIYWIFVASALVLTWVGASPVEEPFSILGKIATIAYFTAINVLFSNSF